MYKTPTNTEPDVNKQTGESTIIYQRVQEHANLSTMKQDQMQKVANIVNVQLFPEVPDSACNNLHEKLAVISYYWDLK